jgi:dihydropteroate synthase
MHYQWPRAGEVQIMGILNLTPDSFSDGGQFLARDTALRHAEQMLSDGADIIDIGGESTRPGADSVSLQQELDRVMPVIEALRALPVVLSVDTQKAAVMNAALQAGVHIVNDVNALGDENAVQIVVHHQAAVVLMHMQGLPRTMQHNPHYDDVTREVQQFLQQRVEVCVQAGLHPDRIALDPGFGFGKSLQHNVQLLRELKQFTRSTHSIVIGLSRKSLIGQLTGAEVGARVNGSVVLAQIALQHGARILRVHDVKETKEMLTLWQAVNENK